MFHIGVQFSLTDYALDRSGAVHREFPATSPSNCRTNANLVSPDDQWNDVKGHFLDHIDEINRDLIAAGLPILNGSTKASNTIIPELIPAPAAVSNSALPIPKENLEKTCPAGAQKSLPTSPESAASAPWEMVPDIKVAGEQLQ